MADFAEWGPRGGGVSTAISDLNTMATTAMHSQATERDRQMLPGDLRKQGLEIEAAPIKMLESLAHAHQMAAKAGMDYLTTNEMGSTSKAINDWYKEEGGDPFGVGGGQQEAGPAQTEGPWQEGLGQPPQRRRAGPPKMSQALIRMASKVGKVAPNSMFGILKIAEDFKGQENTADSNQQKVLENQHKIENEQAVWFEQQARLYGDTPHGWKKVNDDFERKYGRPSAFAPMPYFPGINKLAADQVLTVHQKRQLEQQQERIDLTEQGNEDRRKIQGQILDLRRDFLDLQRMQEDRLGKVGGRVHEPSKLAIESVTARILQDFPNAMRGEKNRDQTERYARDVAEGAIRLRETTHRTWTPSQAEEHVYNLTKDDFKVIAGTPEQGGWGKPKIPAKPESFRYEPRTPPPIEAPRSRTEAPRKINEAYGETPKTDVSKLPKLPFNKTLWKKDKAYNFNGKKVTYLGDDKWDVEE